MAQEFFLPESEGEITLKLKKGRKVDIRVVDAMNQPIQKVGIIEYRDYSLGPFKVENLQTDRSGLATWGNAPFTPTKIMASKEGMPNQIVVLDPSEHEKLIVLNAYSTLSGEVKDSQTGNLLTNSRFSFGIFRGRRSGPYFHQPDVQSIQWLKFNEGDFRISTGSFQIHVPPKGAFFEPEDKFAFRIEAPGYETFVSENYDPFTVQNHLPFQNVVLKRTQ